MSACANVPQETSDFTAEETGLCGQLTSRVQHVVGDGIAPYGSLIHDSDIGGNAIRTRSRLLNVATDFLGGCTFFLHGRCNHGRIAVDGGDDLRNFPEFLGRLIGHGLNVVHVRSNLLRGLGGLSGKRLDLGCHDGEPLSKLSGTRRLDRRIQSEQIGLVRNRTDQVDDSTDTSHRR